jgi:hypothetical protein
MARTGRKPLPIEPYIEKLEQAILLGATYELAAMYAGISNRTFATWREKAATAKEGTPLAQLRDRLTQAEGRAAVGWLAHIEKAAREGDFRAAAWKLERRYPEFYGRRLQADLTLQIQKAAQAVADEVGIDVQLVLREAQAYLMEGKRASTP